MHAPDDALDATHRATRRPDAQTRGFVSTTAVITVAFALLVRFRVYELMSFRSDRPLLWFLAALCDDVAVIYGFAAIALAIASFQKAQRFAREMFGLFVLLFCLGTYALSEVIIYLGGGLRPEDFSVVNPRDVLRSAIDARSTIAMLIVPVLVSIELFSSMHLPRRLRFRWVTAPRAAIIAIIAAALTPLFTTVHRVPASRNVVTALLRIGAEQRRSLAAGRAVVPDSSLPITSVRLLSGEQRDWISDEFPLAYKPREVMPPPAVKPNIVFFVIESLRAEESTGWGNDPPGATPNLDAIARDGIRVNRFYSNGSFTASAEAALWYGVAPIPREVMVASRPETPLTGLPEILRANGWKSLLWIHNGMTNFYRRDLFYKPRGIEMIDGNSFDESEPQTNWGASDRALARNAVEILSHTPEPFAVLTLTVSNHHPFDLPQDAGTPLPVRDTRRDLRSLVNTLSVMPNRTVAMIQTVHYSDAALGDFFALAHSKPWFAHTIFVICGDHGVAIAPLQRTIDTRAELENAWHRVPLVIYSPMIPGGRTIEGPVSQIDLLPTLLDLAGVASPRCGIGSDFLGPARPPDIPVITWSVQSRTVNVITKAFTYRALYQRDAPLSLQEPEEVLIDNEVDPEGKYDVSAQHAREFARMRQLARVYIEVYPRVIIEGRHRVPPPAATSKRRP